MNSASESWVHRLRRYVQRPRSNLVKGTCRSIWQVQVARFAACVIHLRAHPAGLSTCTIQGLTPRMESQVLWHLFHPIHTCASGHRSNPVPFCGGLCLVNMHGFSKRKGMVNKLSRQSDTALIPSNSYRSRADQTVSEPLTLLPCTKVNFSIAASLEEELDTSLDSFESLYRIEVTTSNDAYSSLNDLNAGILICIIGENSNSIIQRIPAIAPDLEVLSVETAKIVQKTSDRLCFQRGSVDIVTFSGPDLGRLAELWIGPESGSWRLGGVNVMAIPLIQKSGNGMNNTEKQNICNRGLYHIFQTNEVVLGDGGNLSAAELKPCEIRELSGIDIWMKPPNPSQLGRRVTSKDVEKLQQESLREYRDLKFSLLLYNAILVASGTSIAAIVANQEISKGFAVGGVCGFIYLLLLQRSVDRLPGSSSFPSGSTGEKSPFEDDNTSKELKTGVQIMGGKERNMSSQVESRNGNFRENFSGFRGPLTSLTWIIATVFVASRYIPENIMLSLKPQELLAGAAGFLTCKVAVVIAAFRTLPADWKNYRK